MNLDENELMRRTEEAAEAASLETVPQELDKEVNAVLGNKDRVKVDRTTDEGRKLLAWARNRRKAQRKARRKNRN